MAMFRARSFNSQSRDHRPTPDPLSSSLRAREQGGPRCLDFIVPNRPAEFTPSRADPIAALFQYVPKPEESAKFQETMRDLSNSVETLQQELAGLDPSFSDQWSERTASHDSMKRVLPPDAALIDILEYEHYQAGATLPTGASPTVHR
jgi:hypothetical protein